MGGIEEVIKKGGVVVEPKRGSFEDFLPVLFEHEGGYVNHPKDPGGETKYGISKRAYPNEDIRNLTKGRAAQLYRRDYWDRCRCDDIPFSLACMLFDDAVNAGPGSAIPRFQRAIGVADDGIIGPVTLSKANAVDEEFALMEYREFREIFYRRLRNFPTFGRGWLRRLEGTFEFCIKYV